MSSNKGPEDREETHPFKAIYPCRYGCGFQGTPQELSSHYRREHKEDREPDREPTGREGDPPQGEVDLTTDFRSETKVASSALNLARAQERLRQTNPTLYRALYGPGEEPTSPTTKLLDLQILSYIKSLQEEAEEKKRPEGNHEVVAALREEIQESRKEISELREEMRGREISELKAEIKELKDGLKSSTSDLQFVVGRATDLVDRWVTQGGGPGAEVLLGALGYTKVPIQSEPPPIPTDTPKPPLEELRKEGLVVKVRRVE